MNDSLEQLSRTGPGAVKMGTSGRPLLTVFLLVRDEEETLDRAIDSVTALGPEIVVGVDADSRDETRKIAERRAHRVIDVEFERELRGDFSAARNLLDEHGTGTWGLALDGHEYLEPDSAGPLEALLAASESTKWPGVAFSLLMDEREGGDRAMVLRCWQRGPQVRYERPVHETLVGMGDSVLGRPDLVIRHARSASRELARRAQRATRDLALLRDRRSRFPDDIVNAWHLSQLLEETGERGEARLLGEWVLARSEARKPVFQVRVLLHLATISLSEKRWSDATTLAHRALGLIWNSVEAWAIIAQASIGAGDFPRAVHALHVMPLTSGHDELPTPIRFETWWPHVMLARTALRLGRIDLATRAFQTALAWELPEDVRAEVGPWAGVPIGGAR